MTANATPARLRDLAAIGYRSMERATRDDGTEYVRKTEDCPGWVASIIQSAHGDMLPDDQRYAMIREAFSHIEDTSTDDADEPRDPHDIADSTTDVYNGDLLAWVGSNGTRGGYVDEARGELGEPRDFYHGLQMGQYQERAEVYGLVLDGLRSVDTEQDEEEDAAIS